MPKRIELKESMNASRAEQMLSSDPDSFKDAKCCAHRSELLTIEADGKESGFVLLGYWQGDDGVAVEVSKFFVKPECRGEDGISVAAAREVLSLLKKRGHEHYVLHSLNEKASHFWKKALSEVSYREDGSLFRVGEEVS
ncbi:hypothetical protein GIW50_07795 [Pseudomonas syringae]|uniref:N-acetyltransferase domain-containing protein n=1 Tax=Pseudomonas syringae TaxID=317 RepID=A0A9Q3X3Q2_PSESX|nr:hypothetical protein [Pseudomonas syringae]MCF5062117.1 hypothetical protein [Pseudomonas syringae]MCF5072283.1 hypothetical protein [Pseudomonas syringae]MCF5118310.1 hypothetical protein [Pseudomonas syringae]MCF5378258.1 hypothetical protein [Pseudomonas syringae]